MRALVAGLVDMAPLVLMRVVSVVLNLVFVVLVARALSGSDLGGYYLGLTLAAVATALVLAPCESHLMRAWAQYLARRGVPLADGLKYMLGAWPYLLVLLPSIVLPSMFLVNQDGALIGASALLVAISAAGVSMARSFASSAGHPTLASGALLTEVVGKTLSFVVLPTSFSCYVVAPLLCSVVGSVASLLVLVLMLKRKSALLPGGTAMAPGGLGLTMREMATGNIGNLCVTQGYRPIGHLFGQAEAVGVFAFVFNLGSTAGGVLSSSVIQLRSSAIMRNGRGAIAGSLTLLVVAAVCAGVIAPIGVVVGMPILGKPEFASSWAIAIFGVCSDALSAAIGLTVLAYAAAGARYGLIAVAGVAAAAVWGIGTFACYTYGLPPIINMMAPMLSGQAVLLVLVHRGLSRSTNAL